MFIYLLTGNLPRDMWNLTKLQNLFLGWNNITGTYLGSKSNSHFKG